MVGGGWLRLPTSRGSEATMLINMFGHYAADIVKIVIGIGGAFLLILILVYGGGKKK